MSAPMSDQPFTIEAGGHRLRAQWVAGPAEAGATALVFLHEGLGSIGQWRGFPAELCRATGLPGLIYERWGFGGSDRLELPRPTDYLAVEAERALPEVLAACGIARPILVGHSDGGSIALLFASAFPKDVVACVSMAAHVFVEDVTIAGIREVVARWKAGDLKPRLAKYHGANTVTMFRGWAETWLRPDFRGWNIEDRLAAITCPLLVIQGEDDEHGSVAQVEAIAQGASGRAEAVMIPACGHSPHLEAGETVVSRIAVFVAALDNEPG